MCYLNAGLIDGRTARGQEAERSGQGGILAATEADQPRARVGEIAVAVEGGLDVGEHAAFCEQGLGGSSILDQTMVERDLARPSPHFPHAHFSLSPPAALWV